MKPIKREEPTLPCDLYHPRYSPNCSMLNNHTVHFVVGSGVVGWVAIISLSYLTVCLYWCHKGL